MELPKTSHQLAATPPPERPLRVERANAAGSHAAGFASSAKASNTAATPACSGARANASINS
jgi:hypothetical protein